MADILVSLEEVISKIETVAKLELSENHYIKELSPFFTDISAKIHIAGVVVYGRGISDDANLSLKKAVFEALERACFLGTKFQTTNGFALADNFDLAKNNAINELIEREIFLRQWNNKISFFAVLNEQTELLSDLFYKVYPESIEVNFFKSKISINKKSLYICKISGHSHTDNFGSYFGFGCKSDCQKSILHSFFEAINSFASDFENNLLKENITLKEFKEKDKYLFRDHGLLSKNIEYSRIINEIYFRDCDSVIKDYYYDDSSFKTDKIKVPFNLPLACIKVTNDDFLIFNAGLADENLLPHPID